MNGFKFQVESARWITDSVYAIAIEGWCVSSDDISLEKISARVGGNLVTEVNLSPRPDVQIHLASCQNALNSGFSLRLPLIDPKDEIELHATAVRGHSELFHTISVGDLPGLNPLVREYPSWRSELESVYPTEDARITGLLAGIKEKPLFSIILPVFNPRRSFLSECINSIRDQVYQNWELCIIDDASTDLSIKPILQKAAADDARIRVQYSSENQNISRATNAMLYAAAGSFVVFVDHDDVVHPHALGEIALRLHEKPLLDVVYTDEEKIDSEGNTVYPFLKPGPSPTFLCGVMYVGHMLCVRAKLARELGGLNPEYDGIQDYEFALRLFELTTRIGHIPRILYQWRMSPSSSSLVGNIKGDMDALHVRAVQSHLARTGFPADAVALGGHRVRLRPHPVIDASAVTILAYDSTYVPPLRNSRAKLCIIPEGPHALATAIRLIDTEFVILITAELTSAQPDWIESLQLQAFASDSGAIGPMLLSRSDRVYGSGLAESPSGTWSLVMSGFNPNHDGYNGSLICDREVSALPPHCLAVRRCQLLEALDHGVDASRDDFSIALCGYFTRLGLRNIVCAGAKLTIVDDFAGSTGLPASISPTTNSRRSGDTFYHPYFDSKFGDYRLGSVWNSSRPPIRLFIDEPKSWRLVSRSLIIKGWCFAAGKSHVSAIRLRVGGLCFTGVLRLERPDVKVTRPDAPDDFTGFDLRGVLPPGKSRVTLEAQTRDGKWHTLRSCTIKVRRWQLPLWLAGSNWTDLMFLQMPLHMVYPPRPVRRDIFPRFSMHPKGPFFSIVTPSYQQATFLSETMRSVLEQSGGVQFEYVVQDGASQDGSVELIGQMERSQARLRKKNFRWESVKDRGQSDAIVKGFAKTSGRADDLMAWLNSDDFYPSGTLAYVAGYFARHPEVDVVYGHRVLVDEFSREIGRWFLPRHDNNVLRINDFVPQETLFWRRRIWNKVGGIDPSFRFAMDWDLLLRFQAAGAKMVRLPYFMGCFRLHSAQKSSVQMETVGRAEIDALRHRVFGKKLTAREIETHPVLLRYLRQSARLEFLANFGYRGPAG
ncbi:glycosyltransferase [Opitutaceae bacterium]|nr:glycosyltransferase [Opitutaceae bacterium]